tara:strand:- start:4032 stop:5873 length:1842 start_codon:yes stop_codon:yes gene_type:complete
MGKFFYRTNYKRGGKMMNPYANGGGIPSNELPSLVPLKNDGIPVIPEAGYDDFFNNLITSGDLNPYTGLRRDHPLAIKEQQQKKQVKHQDYQDKVLKHRTESLTLPSTGLVPPTQYQSGGVTKKYAIGGQIGGGEGDSILDMDLISKANEEWASKFDRMRRRKQDRDIMEDMFGSGEGSTLSQFGKYGQSAQTTIDMWDTLTGEGDPEGPTGISSVMAGAKAGGDIGSVFGPTGRVVGTVVGTVAGSAVSTKNKKAAYSQNMQDLLSGNIELAKQEMTSSMSEAKSKKYIEELLREQQQGGGAEMLTAAENVESGLTSPKKGNVLGARGLKIAGDINPHVEDVNYNNYFYSLSQAENAQKKGYDAKTGLWKPFATGVGDEMNIGYGINIAHFSAADREKFSKGITEKEMNKMFNAQIAKHLDKSRDYINTWDGSWTRRNRSTGEVMSGNTGYTGSTGNWEALPDNVKLALTDYSYNLGGLEKFPRFVTAVMNNDLATAKEEYKRHYYQGDTKHEMTSRNNMIHNMLFKNAKSKTKIYGSGGLTTGKYDHETNPLYVMDKNGNNTGMELTGGEGVYDAKAQNEIEKALKKKNYKKVGKIIEYEINDWKRRGMYS